MPAHSAACSPAPPDLLVLATFSDDQSSPDSPAVLPSMTVTRMQALCFIPGCSLICGPVLLIVVLLVVCLSAAAPSSHIFASVAHHIGLPSCPLWFSGLSSFTP